MKSSFTTILKLSGWKNYHPWENYVYGLLAQHGFYQIFNEDFDQSSLTAPERAKIAGIIITSLDEEVARKISVNHRLDPKGLLKFLKESYGKSEASYVSIGMSLLNMELNEISDIESFLENCKNLYNDINKLASDGDKLCEKFFVTIVLSKVKNKFRFITDLELNPDATINMANIFGKMISEVRSIKNNQSSSASDIDNNLNVMAASRYNRLFCSYCKRNNHTFKNCFRRLRALTQNQDSSSSSSAEVQSDNSDKFKNASGASIFVNSFSQNHDRNSWLFDSGADHHFCCNRKLFKKIWKINRIYISQFNPNDRITCDEYGSIDITTDTGVLEIEAYYVPQGQNVISVTRLSRSGFSVLFTKTGLKITKDNDLVWLIEKQTHGRFFSACPVQSSSKNWHNILGHADFNKLKILSQKYSFVQSKPYECDVCTANKMCKPNFDKSQHHHSKLPMEVLYADLCGPFPSSIHNQKYMLVIIDQCSRFSQVFFLKDKSAVSIHSYIKYFIEFIERNTNFCVKRLVTDNGGEFVNEIVNNYFRSKGIIHVTTTAYTPQSNGLVERKNRSLLNMARCLLNHINLPKKLWPYALSYANEIQNRLPSANNNQIPFETVFNSKIDFNKFHMFGSKVFIKLNHFDDKLVPRASPVMFIGLDHSKFIVYDPKTNKITSSRNIKFTDEIYSIQDPNYETSSIFSNFIQQLDYHSKQDFDDDNYDSSDYVISEIPIIDTQTSDFNINLIHHDFNSSIDETSNHTDGMSNHASLVNRQSDDSSISNDDLSFSNSINDSEATIENNDLPIAWRKPDRSVKIPDRLGVAASSSSLSSALSSSSDLFSSSINDSIPIPKNFKDAMNSPHKNQWLAAINDEIKSFHEFNVLSSVPNNNQPTIDSKWVFAIKRDVNGKIEKFKARLVVRGFKQEDVDINDTFSPVVDKTTIRSLFVLAHRFNWHAIHFDVKTAFLHGKLDQDVFITVPDPLKTDGFIFKLNKSMYGLRQAPRVWFNTLVDHLNRIGLVQLDGNICVFSDGGPNIENSLIIACYVDDILCFGPLLKIESFGKRISGAIKIKNLGPVQKYLGIEIIKSNDGFHLSQSKYIESLSVQYQVNEAKYVKCPLLNSLLVDSNDKSTNFPIRNLIGSLLYIANWTRPDICTAVNQVSQYLHKPTDRLWRHALNILKYLNSTKNISLRLCSQTNEIIGFADANFATDSIDRKSISGNVVFLFGSVVDWSSTKQKIVAESTSVAELIALHGCIKKLEIIYCCLVGLKLKIDLPIKVYEDSQNVLQKINKGLSKSLDVKLKYIIEQTNLGLIKLNFISTKQQIADPLTKIVIQDYEEIRKNFCLT